MLTLLGEAWLKNQITIQVIPSAEAERSGKPAVKISDILTPTAEPAQN
jgi:hypothetical protein